MTKQTCTRLLACLGLTVSLASLPANGQILSEGFEGSPAIPAGSGAPPGDDITLPSGTWRRQNNSTPIGGTSVFQGNTAVFTPQAGAGYAGMNFNNGSGLATISTWFMTPPVVLANGHTFKFWTRTVSTVGFPDRLQVRMSLAGASTNVGTGATAVGDFTTLLLDINPTYTTTGYPNTWTEFTITLAGIPSPTQGRLAFRYFVENGGPNGANSDYIGIDTVELAGQVDPCGQPLPSCRTDVGGANNGPPDGVTNVSDLLIVINTWGQTQNPPGSGPRPKGDCHPLPNGDCVVNVSDLLAVISGWGPCPQATGRCCFPDGTCQVMTQANCTSGGGQYDGDNTNCTPNPCPQPPSNDECAGATALTIGAPCVTGSLLDATQDNPQPACGPAPGKGRWYKVTGNGNTLTASTCGSDQGQFYNSKITVYCGFGCDELFCIGGADQDSCGLFESFSWCSMAGRTYFILVHTDDAAGQGGFCVNVTSGASCNNPLPCGSPPAPPGADGCANAPDVTAWIDTGAFNGNNSTATPPGSCGNDPELPAGSPTCQWAGQPNCPHNTVWYKVTAPASGSLRAETCATTSGALVDSVIAIYSGTCGNLTQVACGEDECGGTLYLSQATATGLVPGNTYYIMVASTGSWTGAVPGAYKLTLDSLAAPGACCYNGSCIGTIPQGACTAQYGYFTAGQSCPITCDNNCPGAVHSMQRIPATGAWTFATSDPHAGTGGYLVADKFPWLAGGNVNSIRVHAIDAFNNGTSWSACTQSAATFNVVIYADAAGVPGAALCTHNGITGTFASSESYGGFPAGYYTINLPSPCTLPSGQYWISVQGASGPDSCWFLWGNAQGGPGTARQTDLSNNQTTALGYNMAICINAP